MSDRYTDLTTGHSDEADGIEEYDNKMPTWWLGIFYVSIVWAAAYFLHYHVVANKSQAAAFDQEMAEAAERWPVAEVTAVEVTEDAVSAGAVIFATNCAACHGAELQGGPIAPSLVDPVWIHGSGVEQIRATITQGVLEKGMPAWEKVLGPAKVAQVAAFVHDAFIRNNAGLQAGATVEGAQ